jgi:hypothetical protein
MTLSFEHVRPAPGPTKPPCPVVKVAASIENAGLPTRQEHVVRGHTAATNESELFADHTTTTRAEQADLHVTFQQD